MIKEIPLLTARDVELRVGSMNKDGTSCTLLAYKDARVDRRILDSVYGPMNWQRNHQLIDGQLFCTVSVYDSEKGQWISKQDVGKESKTEAEKGRASDSFKRACFAWGIGVELYDAPDIRVTLDSKDVYNGKLSQFTKFHVKEMEYDRELGEFTKFVVVDQKGRERYRLGAEQKTYAANKDKTLSDEQKQVQERTKPVTPSGNTQNQFQAVTEALGGSVAELPAMVRAYNGKMQIYVKDAWMSLSAMNEKQLEFVLRHTEYKEAHGEAQYYLNKLKK